MSDPFPMKCGCIILYCAKFDVFRYLRFMGNVAMVERNILVEGHFATVQLLRAILRCRRLSDMGENELLGGLPGAVRIGWCKA